MMKSRKYVTISVAAFICYCNTLWGTFVFDDTEAIVKNKDVLPHTPLANTFNNDFWGTDITLNTSHKSYRPLTVLSYRLNVLYSNNKFDPFQFHATNVILYGLLCILSISVFELFSKKKRKNKLGQNVQDEAFWSSLLFTVHPVHTEAVAGLVGRADILSSILFFAVLLLYSKVIDKKSSLLFVIMLLLVYMAVLCKETAITVLGMCCVYDVFKEKKRKKSWTNIFKSHYIFRNVVLALAGILILYFRFKVMNFEGPIFTEADNPAAYCENCTMWSKIVTHNYIYFLNFVLLIWPQWLCFDWSMGCVPLIESFFDIRLIFVIGFWILGALACYKLIDSSLSMNVVDPRVMGVSLIILPFLPASNILFKVGFVIAERTLLLPSAGFCYLIILGLKKIERITKSKKICTSVLYTVVVIFGIRTICRNFSWLSEDNLFSSGLDVCPLNAKVHYNVAKMASDKGDKELALVEYKIALELHPYYEQAMNNLANMLREQAKFKEAESLLRQAVKVRPNFAAAWMNLGILLSSINETEEAEHCYHTAIMHRHKYPDCYYNLGNLYLDMNKSNEALKSWEMAVLYKPTHVAAWGNTLVLLDTMKRYDEVLEFGRTALMHNPTAPTIHFSLGNTLGKMKNFERAEAHFLEAINFSPKNPLYYSNLGVLYHRWGKMDAAREMYQKALLYDPHLKSAEFNLKKLSSTK